MNMNTERLLTALLTLSIGGVLVLALLHFALANRVSILEDTVIGLTKDQIVNMERLDAIENTQRAVLEMQKDKMKGMKRLQEEQ